MSNPKYTNLPYESFDGDPLAQLALNLRSSWNHASDEVWRRLDAGLWNLTRNPWLILQSVSEDTLNKANADPAFLKLIAECTAANNAGPRWFEKTHPNSPLQTVAYFSMEYMLSEALPIYSGGLGNVAGDQLKAADDLGVPVVAIGLLYQRGYFRQSLDQDGGQVEVYPYNDPSQLPVTPVRDSHGTRVLLSVILPGVTVWIRAWQAQVGRTKLYLLDTNDPSNLPEYRSLTGELYGGGPEMRLRQEKILGIGGWRLLRTLGMSPEVCHLNEGHAAFAVLERAADYMQQTNLPFAAALSITRAGNLFTTHTPVEAGFDRFPADLFRTHFGDYADTRLHISVDQLLALGRANPHDEGEPFNMAYLAMRGCGAVNGVSRLHGEVSRKIFLPLFPRWPQREVPVHHVTNGVHVSTWDSDGADGLWTEVCGKGVWRGELEDVRERLQRANDQALWKLRSEARKILVDYVRARYQRQVAAQGWSTQGIDAAGKVLDPGVLTLGFARRFATYKRPTLLLHDQERLLRILFDQNRPVQLIVAGKAHPADHTGQEMIREWNHFIRQHGPLSNVVFLSDYDMLMTEQLVGGVDVWINTPRRPWEACGTSGMKVLVNGGLNISELDGWWAEAYAPELGWALGDGKEHDDDPAWDAAEADRLYTLLEHEVAPQFYDRDSSGVPTGWLARIRASMSRLTPMFSANRAVREYTDQHYLPAAASYTHRAADAGKLGKEIAGWEEKLAASWSKIHFGDVGIQRRDDGIHFEAAVYLGEVEPVMVRVEVFADTSDGSLPFRQEMTLGHHADGWGRFSTSVAPTRALGDYTVRVVAHHEGVSLPLECNYILWQR